MEATQMFRLLGGTDIQELTAVKVDGEHVVFWEDIKDVFPGVQHVKNGRLFISYLRSSESNERIVPHRIKYWPGVILDVVLSIPAEQVPTAVQTSGQEPTSQQTTAPTIKTTSAISDFLLSLQSRSLPTTELTGDPLPNFSFASLMNKLPATEPKTSLMTSPTKSTTASSLSRQPERSLTPEMIAHTTSAASPTPATNVKVTTDQTCLQPMVKRQNIATTRISKMGIRTDRHTIIREKAEAIFTQSCGFDCTIPRFFVVLPEAPVLWNPMTMVLTKFRLYFVCTCGAHVESTNEIFVSGNRVSGMLHLPYHEGYVVKNPASFFREHGPFLLVALETLKESLRADVLFASSTETAISERAEYSLKYLQKVRFNTLDSASDEAGSKTAHKDLSSYLAGVETRDKVTLDQLRSCLKSDDPDGFMGDMFHVLTKDGHFDWVCQDKHQLCHTEEGTRELRHVVGMGGGEFNEKMGKVEITKDSGVDAATLFESMKSTKRVFDLRLFICDMEVFEPLAEAVKASEVIILRLDLRPRSFLRNNSPFPTLELFQILLDIQQLPAMKLITVSVHPKEYFEFLTLQSHQSDGCSHHCKLQFELSIGSSIGMHGVRSVAEALQVNSTHSALRLIDSSIMCDGVKILAEALLVNSTLTALDLSYNLIGSGGAKALATALESNSNLTILNLGNNFSLQHNGANVIAGALKTNRTLTTLLLKTTYIGPKGAKAIADVLRVNSTLITLDLEETSIESTGAISLSDALKTNSTLANLALGDNLVGNSGAHALFEALAYNKSLATLSLEKNCIFDDGLQSMAKLLRTNVALRQLRLDKNRVSDDALGAVAEALKANSTLTELHLQSNQIGDVGAKAFADALKVNTTLVTLNLGKNIKIGQVGALALVNALKTTKCNIDFATVA